MMLKASALFYSIIISLIIAIISGSVILLAGLSAEEFQRSSTMNDLHLNADSGLNLLLSEKRDADTDETQLIDLFGNGNDSVLLKRKYWGAFVVLISEAFRKGLQVKRIAQAGFFPDSTDNYCLYIPDQDKPLAICGNTEIRGTAFLPKAGVKRTYIEGQNYFGTSLVYGNIKNSKRKLPEFNKQLPGRIKSFVEELYNNDNSILNEPEANVKNSFLNNPVVISDNGNIKIEGHYSGNIAIISKTMVTIGAEASLQDVIVYAPKVKINKGFKGNLQVFATDSIVVEENVSLNYPSVLGIVQENSSSKISFLVLSENDTIKGSIFAYGTEHSINQKEVSIVIEKKSVIYGQVYSTGFADIQGSIFGSLMCNKILLQTSSSVYENHLLNAVIDRTRLPFGYVGINLVEESDYKKVVKWLN